MKVKGNELSKIIIAGDPILKSVAMPVTAFDKKLKFLVNEMKKTMYESNGVGLAAPQIAVSKRVFVADDGESGFEAYINPRWTSYELNECRKYIFKHASWHENSYHKMNFNKSIF